MTGDQASFARYIGVNKSTVTRARKAGRLVITPEGLVDFEASVAKWHETAGTRRDVSARHAKNRGAVMPVGQRRPENAPAAPDSAEDIDSNERMDAQITLLHFQNAMARLEIDLRRGMRFPREVVKREAQGLGAMVRAGIERVIDQTAPRIAAANNEIERRRILDKEIRRLRWVIKRELPRTLRRMRDAARNTTTGKE